MCIGQVSCKWYEGSYRECTEFRLEVVLHLRMLKVYPLRLLRLTGSSDEAEGSLDRIFRNMTATLDWERFGVSVVFKPWHLIVGDPQCRQQEN
jgi:hypothetical protein